MSREMLQLAEALASEKNVETEVVFKALEFALSTAAKKKADREHMDVRVEIDEATEGKPVVFVTRTCRRLFEGSALVRRRN